MKIKIGHEVDQDSNIPEREFLKTVDIIKWMGISRQTLYKLINNENLPCKQVGHTKYFFKPDVLDWMKTK